MGAHTIAIEKISLEKIELEKIATQSEKYFTVQMNS
tara:strand:+ start:2580 stop:2687 length:108 start_codon:yes stop_codon:yes gene_type:complete